MPPFEAFVDTTSYYATLAHETTHWSGAKHRLDRNLTGRFGEEAYAMEELIAELGAAFLVSDLGLSSEPRPDHASYIASWLKVLKSDKRAIFTASSKAQSAADYLNGLQPRPALTEEKWRDMIDEANRTFQLSDPENDEPLREEQQPKAARMPRPAAIKPSLG